MNFTINPINQKDIAPIPEQNTPINPENLHTKLHVKFIKIHVQELGKISQKLGATKNVSSSWDGEQCVLDV